MPSKFLGVLSVLLAFASTQALATSAGPGDQAVLKGLIEKKEIEIAGNLKQVSDKQAELGELKSLIEEAKASSRRAKLIGIPVVLVGSAVFLASAYKLKTDKFNDWSGWINLRAIPKTGYTLLGGAGALAAGGAGYNIYVKTEKLGELEQTIAEAEIVLARLNAKLETERDELRVLKEAAGL